ncbi:PadR family transcriptional regulator, partial [Streptomyces spiramenti]
MSIRFGLLALLERGPSHGAQLRLDFEARTGATWPLNIGQVYMTLARLERDGLVESRTGAGARQHYAITDAGRREVGEWYARPVDRSQPARDELAIKVAMAVGTQGSGIGDVIAIQRRHTLRAMQGYARLKLRTALDGPSDRRVLAWLLVLEQLVFQAEAEVRWLAHCERQLTDGGTTATDRDDHGHRPGGRPAGGPPEAEPGRPGAARAGGGAG